MEVFPRTPLFLVSFCSRSRQPVLTSQGMPTALAECLREAAAATGWSVGRYVVMPDHMHLFCAPSPEADALSAFVGRFKARSTRRAWTFGLSGRIWQAEFHDHMLRSEESYAQKWEYVRHNPVRAGLCLEPEDWPHQGEMEDLEVRG
jgi:REP element-mobilizing transposase RayT